MADPDALMLFAAGFGTRMRPLTDHRPKPLIEVGGRSLLDHTLQIAREAAMAPIVVNTHYFADQIRDHLAGMEGVGISAETGTILDTGGGLKRALPLLGSEIVATMNTDAVWTGPNPLSCLQRAWDPARMDGLLLLVPRARAAGHTGAGDFDLQADGRIVLGRDQVYSGAQIIRAAAVKSVSAERFSLNQVWDRIASEGRLFGTIHAGGWCDVGRPAAIAVAEALLREAAVQAPGTAR